MAEYVPVHTPGNAITLRASAAVKAGEIVEVSGAGTVAPAAAGSVKWVGVAVFDAAVNDEVTIHSGGTQEVVASAAIAAGALVSTAAGGEVATAGATPAAGAVVGVALTAAAGDQSLVRVRFER